MPRPPVFRFEQRMQLRRPTTQRLLTLANSRYLSVLVELAELPELPRDVIDILLHNPKVLRFDKYQSRMHQSPMHQRFWLAMCRRTDLTVENQQWLLRLAGSEPDNRCGDAYYHTSASPCHTDECPRHVLAKNPSIRPGAIREVILPEVRAGAYRWGWFIQAAPLSLSLARDLSMGGRCPANTAMSLAINPSVEPSLGAQMLQYVLEDTSVHTHKTQMYNLLRRGEVPLSTALQCPIRFLPAEEVSRVISDLSADVQDRVWRRYRTHSDLTLEVVIQDAHTPLRAAASTIARPTRSFWNLFGRQSESRAPEDTRAQEAVSASSFRERLGASRGAIDGLLAHLPPDVADEVGKASESLHTQGLRLVSHLQAMSDALQANPLSSREAEEAYDVVHTQVVSCVEEFDQLVDASADLSAAWDETKNFRPVLDMVQAHTMALRELNPVQYLLSSGEDTHDTSVRDAH